MQIQDFKKINNYLWEIPSSFRHDMRVPARIYASEKIIKDSLKDHSFDQLINVSTLPGIQRYALAMPDIHEGYASPIGGVAAIKISQGIISPGMCGYDINCGIRLLTSQYLEQDIRPLLEKLASKIQEEVPSGLGKGRRNKINLDQVDAILEKGAQRLVEQSYGEKQDIENCESQGRLDWADPLAVSLHAKNRGKDQVGTLGSGNHFLEIQKVDHIFDKEIADTFGLFEGQVVVMIHTGSRGLGHQVCTDYLKIMIPAMESYGINVCDREFACVPFDSLEGRKYFSAMAAAANYAWANRQLITHYIRKAWQSVLGSSSLTTLYDIAHNIIKKEKYLIEGEETELAVHRKGATRAFPPGHLEIPQRYQKSGQPVLIPGSMGTHSYIMAGAHGGEEAFYSSCHGSGRSMSRNQAIKTLEGDKIAKDLKAKGILIKSQSLKGIAEEAPDAYKDVNEVIEVVSSAGLSKKVARVFPLAVIKGE